LTTRLNKHATQQSASTQKLRPNTSYLQLGGLNNLFYAVMTVFAQKNGSIFAVRNSRGVRRFSPPPLVTRLAAMTDGNVFLSLLPQLETLDSSRRPQKVKFRMASEI